MLIAKIRSRLRPLKNVFKRNPNRFLKNVTGVVHVGANHGQEREAYDRYNLDVIWVEPIPEVFAQLDTNIKPFQKQRAYQALLTDVDSKEYEFHIANNNGASSSILDFKEHKALWPDVGYTSSITLNSTTLASLYEQEQIDGPSYQALIMDTQGSELLVLLGSVPVLHHFEFIKTEVPDFEAYQGCCQLADIEAFMSKHGYREYSRARFAGSAQVGNYFDIVYRKIS